MNNRTSHNLGNFVQSLVKKQIPDQYRPQLCYSLACWELGARRWYQKPAPPSPEQSLLIERCVLPTVSHSSLCPVLISQQHDSVFVKESPDCKHYPHSAAVSLIAAYSIDCALHDICQDSESVEAEHGQGSGGLSKLRAIWKGTVLSNHCSW